MPCHPVQLGALPRPRQARHRRRCAPPLFPQDSDIPMGPTDGDVPDEPAAPPARPTARELALLRPLARQFPNIDAAYAEIARLSAK